MYLCYTAKEDQCWKSTRTCLWAFDTGGIRRRHVPKLFACLKTGSNARRGISESPCATQAIEAVIIVLH